MLSIVRRAQRWPIYTEEVRGCASGRRSRELGWASAATEARDVRRRKLDITTVGVVGAGLMGSGIAEQAARSGYQVVVREIDDDALAAGSARVSRSMARAIERGKMTM